MTQSRFAMFANPRKMQNPGGYMKSIRLWILTVGFACIAGGCIMGGNSDSETIETEKIYRSRISPGHYIGDFDAAEPGTQYEPEFVFRNNGTFRYIVSGSNEALYLLDGQWKAKTDSLYLEDISESYGDFGGFESWDSIINDSSSLRFITDSSFEHLEYLPFAHNGSGKIDWITYRKVIYPAISQGTYEWSQTLNDTTRVAQFTFGDSLHFTLETSENEDTTLHQTSEWLQSGTFLMMKNITLFERDSNKVFNPVETLDVQLLYRVKNITRDAIEVWNGSDWDDFKRVES
jgi:hypothetical protein